jgi:hypothetical protein
LLYLLCRYPLSDNFFQYVKELYLDVQTSRI